MNSMQRYTWAITALALASIYPQETSAGGFTGTEFTTWKVESQDSYIQTSMTMAGVVLTQTHPDTARCLNDWYFAGENLQKRNRAIRQAITAHEAAHPAGVMMALILKECGPLP